MAPLSFISFADFVLTPQVLATNHIALLIFPRHLLTTRLGRTHQQSRVDALLIVITYLLGNSQVIHDDHDNTAVILKIT